MNRSAGIVIQDPEGNVLFLKRSDSGVWASPAGHLEPGETPWEAAKREVFEETGYPGPYFEKKLYGHYQIPGREFWLFFAQVPKKFVPKLDFEHTQYKWASFSKAPKPLHWGLQWLRKS